MNGYDGLMLARVVRFHALDGSCDCQLVYDGSQLTAVPVMSGMVSTSSGLIDLHEPEGTTFDGPTTGTRDIMAVLGEINGQPLVMGFISPPVSQMLFDRPNFRVDRHASDVYSTIDQKGNIELAHPSGTFVRIASSPAHEDLTGQDFDKLWSVTRNKAEAVWLSVSVAKAGKATTTLQIDPAGNVTLVNAGNLTLSSAGSTTINAASLTVNATSTFNGPVAVNGASLEHNGVNVGDSHAHGGVKAGGDVTAGPV